jgi:hypothetical protein
MKEKRILAFCIYRINERKGKQGRVLRKTLSFARKKNRSFILLWVAEKWRKMKGKRILGFCFYI